MRQQDAHEGDVDSEAASDCRDGPIRDRPPQHGPDAGRLSAAASLDIEAASLLEKDEAEEAAIQDATWATARRRTTLLANLAVVMERTDEQMLPAVYRFVGASFGAEPSALGELTLARALMQAIASPFGGLAGHLFDRVWVIAVGCILWAVMAASFCTSSSVSALSLSLWAVTGIGLALIVPNVQSTIADFHFEGDRGTAFGMLQMTSLLGGAFGALYATNMGRRHHFGVEGWRAAFITVAIISFVIGVLYWRFARDPRTVLQERLKRRRQADAAAGAPRSLQDLLQDARGVVTVPSFLIIASQGVVGCIPGNALAFLTLYLQLLGMSDLAASCITVAFLVGQAFGGVIGGAIGDWAAQRYPAHGRVALCQLSVASGIPFCLLIFRGLPQTGTGNMHWLYGFVLLAMGLLTSWPGPVCNVVVFAEVVPEHLRTLIYAFDRSLEGALAACGAPLVGYLSQHAFGFTGSAAAGTVHDAENAAALSDALLVMTIVPWTLCVLCYCGLHFTYAADREAAQSRDIDSAGRADAAAQSMFCSTMESR